MNSNSSSYPREGATEVIGGEIRLQYLEGGVCFMDSRGRSKGAQSSFDPSTRTLIEEIWRNL